VATSQVVVLDALRRLQSHAAAWRAAAEMCLVGASCTDADELADHRSEICRLIGVEPSGRPKEDAEEAPVATRCTRAEAGV
jgi:hypothetical protein